MKHHGILQARILEWVAIPFSRGSSQPRDWTWVVGRHFTIWATREVHSFPHSSVGKSESACNAGDPGLIPGSGRSPAEGSVYPLQYSGLENSMDCRVHGVTKNPTWLSNFHMWSSFQNLPGKLVKNAELLTQNLQGYNPVSTFEISRIRLCSALSWPYAHGESHYLSK